MVRSGLWLSMPVVSEFFGILILIYYSDHPPPHFHARYGDDEALIEISSLRVLRGRLPLRALALVIEWAQIHHGRLIEGWDYAANNKKLQKIPPLQ